MKITLEIPIHQCDALEAIHERGKWLRGRDDVAQEASFALSDLVFQVVREIQKAKNEPSSVVKTLEGNRT